MIFQKGELLSSCCAVVTVNDRAPSVYCPVGVGTSPENNDEQSIDPWIGNQVGGLLCLQFVIVCTI